MKELTHEQLAALIEVEYDSDEPGPYEELEEAGLLDDRWSVTPRGRALVDVALAAVNAELAGEHRDVCWHCGDVLVMRHEPPRCERCPAFGDCYEGDCEEPGCAELVKEQRDGQRSFDPDADGDKWEVHSG